MGTEMNKRIKELAQQADDYATEKCRDGFSNYNSAYDNKFAELIIQDCVDILSGYHGKVIWKNEETGHNHPIFVIQDHFGLERSIKK
jgi:hypothetical protein